MPQPLLADWTPEDFMTVEEGVFVAKHRLAETGLFTDDVLAEVIDSHPPEHLGINTMGTDPNVFDWMEGERNGLSGQEIIQLVRRGQIWINCRKMLDHHPKHAQALHQVYDEIESGKPGFQAQDRTANLLISSPNAWVPYHVDMPMNMLWHIRGTKRVWVYPHFDNRFASVETLGKVCAGEWSEDVPYDSSFDKYALVFDAQPGQLITWPQLTPHRVCNLEGLNVSVSTEHKNARARRRINVHTANHLMRHRFGKECREIGVDGPVAYAKEALARAFRLADKFVGKEKEQFVYPMRFVLDREAPNGYRLKEEKEENYVAPHQEFETAGV